MQEAILRMKRADWVRPLLELLEGQARRAGPNGLSTGQKALAAHLFDIMLSEVPNPLFVTNLLCHVQTGYQAHWKLVTCLLTCHVLLSSMKSTLTSCSVSKHMQA